MIALVIPTYNRSELLKNCLAKIFENSVKPDQIIIIDSSDVKVKKSLSNSSQKIEHEFTAIKSAAVQRNLGIRKVRSDCKYLAFLDDDVLIPNDYFARLIDSIEKSKSIGASGIARNFQIANNSKKNSRIRSIIQKIFFLDSNESGVILKSGVNTSIKRKSDYPIQVEWLIGCSLWKYEKVKNLEFENDFYGQSLGEDVIFSLKASKLGRLVVDTNVVINHLESPIMRPKSEEFMYMWIRNRHRIIEEMNPSLVNHIAYHWANIGKLFQICFLPFPKKILSIKGLLKAYKNILLGRHEN